jgi:hypothetical protein
MQADMYAEMSTCAWAMYIHTCIDAREVHILKIPAPSAHVRSTVTTFSQIVSFSYYIQDTIQFAPLGLTMTGMLLRNPVAISRVLLQVKRKCGGPKS